MTRQETGIIMDILRAAYPRYYSGLPQTELKNAVNLWCEMFDEDITLVAAAVKAFISTDKKGFPPHIGAIKEKIREITRTEEMTEAEAWNLVSTALRNGIYGSKEEFYKLPPIVQKIVGNHNQLREWAAMDSETVQTVIASNFQRSYRVRAQKQREYDSLPSDVKQIAEPISEKFALEASPIEQEVSPWNGM